MSFSRPRNAAAAAYGIAGIQAWKQPGAVLAERQLPVLHAIGQPRHGVGELALVQAPGTALEVRVTETAVLQARQQLILTDVEVHRSEPGAQQRPAILRSEVRSDLAVADVALAHDPLDDRQHGAGVWRLSGVVGVAEAADGQRHRRVRPLGGAALGTVGLGPSGTHVVQELARTGGPRGLGERASDVDSGVVIGPTYGGAPVGLDVHERRQIELLGARPVAGLPDREQLREAAAVAGRQRRLHRVEGMSEGGGDLVFLQIGRAGLHVVVVGLQPLVV